MDLYWLKSFVAVARFRNFTRASEALHLSQPATSRHIQKLERELGVPLFDRTSRAITLTAEGERFLDYAQETLANYNRIVEEVRGASVPLSGELRIAASTIPGEFLVPDLVIQFTRNHPEVEPHIMIGDSSDVIRALEADRSHVGFVGVRQPIADIRYTAIGEDEILLAVPREHPLAQRDKIELNELTGQPFVEREDGSGTTINVHRALARLGLSLPLHRTVMVLNSTDAVLSSVERGVGIGWVSSLALDHRKSDLLARVRLAGHPIRRTLYLATREHQTVPKVASEFAKWVRQTTRHPSQSDEIRQDL